MRCYNNLIDNKCKKTHSIGSKKWEKKVKVFNDLLLYKVEHDILTPLFVFAFLKLFDARMSDHHEHFPHQKNC